MPARLTCTSCPGLNIFLRGLLGRHSAAGREDLQAVRRARRRRRWPDRSPQSMIPPCRSLGTHPSEVCMDLRTVRRRSRQPESVVPGVWLGWLAFLLLAVVSLLAVPGCSRARSAPDAGLQSFSADALMNHIRTLSSDEFEGRGPGSRGEQLTIKYIEDQFRGIGLEPGNPDGSYLQSVPLVGITPDPGMKLTFSGRGRTLGPKFLDDYVAWTKRVQESSSIDAEMIFVGYGVQAAALFRLAGKDLDALTKAAVSRDFRPVPLGVRAKLAIKNTLRMVDSHNVIATLAGSDPKLQGEYVVYVAHWDHFGIGREVNGDKIYHGAKDNASGTAALVEMARAFKRLKAPGRTLLFLATTAEEQGLLGSRYYAEHPLYPLARTAAAINMDALNVLGRTRDIVMIGRGS